jgi:Cupin superfamily protein
VEGAASNDRPYSDLRPAPTHSERRMSRRQSKRTSRLQVHIESSIRSAASGSATTTSMRRSRRQSGCGAPVVCEVGASPSSSSRHATRPSSATPRLRGPIHADAYDTLNVQIRGCKEWTLMPPLSPPNRPESGREEWWCTMQPGDILYIPKLWWHAARPTETCINVNSSHSPPEPHSPARAQA